MRLLGQETKQLSVSILDRARSMLDGVIVEGSKIKHISRNVSDYHVTDELQIDVEGVLICVSLITPIKQLDLNEKAS